MAATWILRGQWATVALSMAMCFLLWPSGTVATGTTTAAPKFIQIMRGHFFLYWSLDEHGQFGPAYWRSQGGIVMNHQPEEQLVETGLWWPHSTMPLSDSLAVAAHGPYKGGSTKARWVYKIAGAPHFVLPSNASNPHPDTMYLAVSSVLWSQIDSWAVTSDDGGRSTDFDWYPNPDYDPRWEQFGVNGPQPLLFTRDQPDTSRQNARHFVADLLSKGNILLDARRLRTLRELYDWNPEREPDRDFPIVRKHTGARQPAGGGWAARGGKENDDASKLGGRVRTMVGQLECGIAPGTCE